MWCALDGDGSGAVSQVELMKFIEALRAWLGTRPEGRMRSGEIDRFFNAHRGLPKPRGIKWLDQYLKQYGMRKRDSGNRSYFFSEVADGSAQ